MFTNHLNQPLQAWLLVRRVLKVNLQFPCSMELRTRSQLTMTTYLWQLLPLEVKIDLADLDPSSITTCHQMSMILPQMTLTWQELILKISRLHNSINSIINRIQEILWQGTMLIIRSTCQSLRALFNHPLQKRKTQMSGILQHLPWTRESLARWTTTWTTNGEMLKKDLTYRNQVVHLSEGVVSLDLSVLHHPLECKILPQETCLTTELECNQT